MWPFTHFNRVHFVPPCTVAEAEVDEGVAALDAALPVADRFCTEYPATAEATTATTGGRAVAVTSAHG